MLPLSGKKILVTRAREQASALGEGLRREGAEVLVVPAIEFAPPDSWCGLDAALTTLRAYDWLLFTSANAVSVFAARARRLGLPAVPRRVAVIGAATARAVLAEGVATQVDLQPDRFIAEALVEALAPEVQGKSVLLVRAAQGRDVLVDGLARAGADVTVAVAYKTVVPVESIAALREAFADAHDVPDAATFTSGSTVNHLYGLLKAADLHLPEKIVTASIGPVTSQALRHVGWEVSLEAQEASLESLIYELATYFSRQTEE